MATLDALGYTPDDEALLQDSVREMILKRKLRKPRTGIPPDWIKPQQQAGHQPKSGTSLLQETLRVNEETVEIGGTVVNQLHDQTGQLRNADATTLEIQEDANKALGILGKIRYRIYREKVIAGTVIIALLAVDAYLAYRLPC